MPVAEAEARANVEAWTWTWAARLWSLTGSPLGLIYAV